MPGDPALHQHQLPEYGAFFLMTAHGLYLYFVENVLMQGALAGIPIDAKMVEILQSQIEDGTIDWPNASVRLCILSGGDIVVRNQSVFLCADPHSAVVDFSRIRVGPWERFKLVNAGGYFEAPGRFSEIPMLMSRHGVTAVAEILPCNEIYNDPRAFTNDQLSYFVAADKNFFNVSPGSFQVEANRVNHGRRFFLSTLYMAQGVIFNEKGFQHNPGFLYLRSDYQNILLCDGGVFADLDALSKRKLYGSYLAAFDGNAFNYYHWLLEGMLGLFVMRSKGFYFPPVIVVGKDGLSDWQSTYLKIFEINSYMVIDGDSADTIEIEDLYWLERRNLPDIAASLFTAMRDFVFSRVPLSDEISPARIYVRRSSGPRSVSNSVELEALLIQLGFEVFAMEDVGLKAQINLFRRASIVVGPHGAGLSNILFCSPETKVIELLPESADVRTCFWCLAEKMQLDYAFLLNDASEGYAGSMSVDLEILKKLIEN